VEALLASCADVNALATVEGMHPARTTALIAAAGKARLGAVHLLLESGADPDGRDSLGRTALIAAVEEGWCPAVHPSCEERHDVMRALIDAGAHTDLVDNQNKTALDYVARYRDDPYTDTKRRILTSGR
jgi:ankyrin repeat protein